jgi:hypothetical protein
VAAKTPNFRPFDIAKGARTEEKHAANQFFRSLLRHFLSPDFGAFPAKRDFLNSPSR